MAGDYVYDPTLDMWPDLRFGRIVLNPGYDGGSCIIKAAPNIFRD